MKCMTCFEEIRYMINWMELLRIPTALERCLCKRCLGELDKVNINDSCYSCGRQAEQANLECTECRQWASKYEVMLKHKAIYRYNNFAKSIIWKIKHNHDYVLIKLLGEMLRTYIVERYNLATVVFVPFPTTSATYQKRGLWITKQILSAARLPYIEVFANVANGPKQHKLDKTSRLLAAEKQLTLLVDVEEIIEKKIILFDDIYTSGATMISAYRCFKEKKISDFESVSIFR